MNKETSSAIDFFTQDKIKVTKRVQHGLTKTFKNRNEAVAHAEKVGSYVYDLYCSVFKHGNSRPIIIPYGWAVPK